MSTIDSELERANKLLRETAFSEAFVIFNNIITQDPNEYRAWVGVGMYMNMTCQYKEAKENFEFVTQQQPNNAVAWYGLAQTLNNMGNPIEACRAIDRAVQIAPNNRSVQLYRAVCYASLGATPEQICEMFTCWGKMFADPITDRAPPFSRPSCTRQQASKKLKIGYVSADLRHHSVAFFMEPVFAHHNPEQVEVYVFSNSTIEDDYTERMKQNVPHWIKIYDQSDDAVFRTIRDIGIDILVDLSGHTLGNRLSLFAMRPAPVQVTWIGYMYPTGMKAIDYRLTSFPLAPPGTEKYYNEALFRTSTSSMYVPPSEVDMNTVPPYMHNAYPTLVSLNHSRKITDTMLNVWHQILKQRPQAQLLILTKELSQEKAFENMLPRLEKLGMPLERIFVSKQLPLSEFMKLGDIADIQLDTYPISGGTTTLHALWMGLPVIGYEGVDAMSISTASILRMCQLDDWIASDEQSYVNAVLDLIDHPEKIQTFRESCRDIMRSSAPMNYSVTIKELENSYRLMWINYLIKEKKYLDSTHNLTTILDSLPYTAAAQVSP
jgi:protein O-GlcNAc transferase